MHFYDVGGLLVRRWVPARRRLAMEAWTGDGWRPYHDVDHVLRFGLRLTDEKALALLHATRSAGGGFSPLSDEEAREALRSRLRRA